MSIIALALLVHASVPTPPVEINHFYITLDRTTFAAIKKSKWLKDEFANVNVSTHSSGADTWTGIYVTGLGSYIEIFQASKKDKEGSAGIGFLTTTPGGADNIYTNFRESSFGTRAQRDVMQLGSVKEQKPFAHVVSYDGQDPTNLNVWLMEFHAAYYERNGVPDGSSSAAVTASYDKRHGLVYKGMMGDITSLTVQPIGDGKDFAQALDLFGFKRGGQAWRQGTNEILVPSATTSAPQYAISSVRFSLRRKPVKAHVERFGVHSRLSVYPDGRAEWRFR